MDFKFENGQLVKDSVSGFEGTIIGKCSYANDSKTYGVCSKNLNNSGETVTQWFDEYRLEIV